MIDYENSSLRLSHSVLTETDTISDFARVATEQDLRKSRRVDMTWATIDSMAEGFRVTWKDVRLMKQLYLD